MTASILPLAAAPRTPYTTLFDCACDLEPGMFAWKAGVIGVVECATRLSVQVRLADESLDWWPAEQTIRVTYRRAQRRPGPGSAA